MKASEARAKVEEYHAWGNYYKTIEKIQKSAMDGKVERDVDYITENTEKKLKEDGYKVENNNTYYRISW